MKVGLIISKKMINLCEDLFEESSFEDDLGFLSVTRTPASYQIEKLICQVVVHNV